MTSPALPNRIRPFAALPAVAFPSVALALMALMALATTAHAQGTDAQRKACAPDAINLCSDTIPDVPKTEACMRRHFNELSPACKTAFNDATGTPPARRDEQSARAEPDGRGRAPALNDGYPEQDIVPGGRQYGYAQPAPLDDGLDTSRDVIAQLCRQGMIDAGTCRRTARMLNMR